MNRSDHLEGSISTTSQQEAPCSFPDPPLHTNDVSEVKVTQVPRGVGGPPVKLWCSMLKSSSSKAPDAAFWTSPNKVVHAGPLGQLRV